jgi:hypothetical protein
VPDDVRTADTPAPLNPDPLAAAPQRGEQAKRDILAAQGELLDVGEVATRLRIGMIALVQRLRDGGLLALRLDDETLKLPAWQFADDGLLPGLLDVMHARPDLGPWGQVLFFTSGDPYLDGRTPLDLLRRGEIEPVQRLAAAYDELVAT